MTTATLTKGMAFYEKQLDFIYNNDVDGLIDNNYNDDAQLVSFDFVITGKEALKEHFRGYLAMLGEMQVKSTDKFTETGDTIFFEATVETANLGEARVFDAFVMRDGKISHHFTGVL